VQGWSGRSGRSDAEIRDEATAGCAVSGRKCTRQPTAGGSPTVARAGRQGNGSLPLDVCGPSHDSSCPGVKDGPRRRVPVNRRRRRRWSSEPTVAWRASVRRYRSRLSQGFIGRSHRCEQPTGRPRRSRPGSATGSAPAIGWPGAASTGKPVGREVQVAHQLAEVGACPQRAKRRLVAVRRRVAISHRGGPSEVIDRPLGRPGRRVRPASTGGRQRRPGTREREPLPAGQRRQPSERLDGPAGAGPRPTSPPDRPVRRSPPGTRPFPPSARPKVSRATLSHGAGLPDRSGPTRPDRETYGQAGGGDPSDAGNPRRTGEPKKRDVFGRLILGEARRSPSRSASARCSASGPFIAAGPGR
jgi:hypothetical protein